MHMQHAQILSTCTYSTCLTQSSLKENWIMNRWMATTLSLSFFLLKITKKHSSLWVDTTRKIHHSCHHACRASRSPMICSTALLVLVSVSCSGHSFLHTVPLLERLFNMHYSGVCHSSCRYPNMSIMQTVHSGHLRYIFVGIITFVREWTGKCVACGEEWWTSQELSQYPSECPTAVPGTRQPD